jgi:tRNA modification GTPase
MRDAAIVTAVPGTTRDLVEVPIVLDGVAAVLIDTAGLRETDDPVEQEGIRRARARASKADLVLHVVDAANPAVAGETIAPAAWVVRNKRDIELDASIGDDHHVSALSGAGMAELRDALCGWAAAAVRPGEPALLANARHREAFAEAAGAVHAASQVDEIVFRTEELRRAAFALGRIAGRVEVDDVLDRIFSQFCIGK